MKSNETLETVSNPLAEFAVTTPKGRIPEPTWIMLDAETYDRIFKESREEEKEYGWNLPPNCS